MTSNFDRVRPRSPRPVTSMNPSAHDAEGKRALFSAVTETTAPGVGTVLTECSRCGERTVMSLAKALRAMWPSLHLGLRIAHGDDVRRVSVVKRDYPSYLRCPACGRPSWTRVTLQI